MPKYRFEAIDQKGQEIKDVVEATTEEYALAMICQMGCNHIKIIDGDMTRSMSVDLMKIETAIVDWVSNYLTGTNAHVDSIQLTALANGVSNILNGMRKVIYRKELEVAVNNNPTMET